jgi:apolipoprotein N-acyltransferase
MTRRYRVLAALISGALFYFSLGLNPFWLAAWFAPVPILLAAFHCEDWREAALLTYIATAIGLSSNFTYYLKTTGLIATPILLLLQILVWGFYVVRTSRTVRNSSNWAAFFVYPILQTGVSTLVSLLSPHGTWGSYVYTQMDALPVIQIASLLGSSAVVFLLGTFASALAIALYKGSRMNLVSGVGYGFVRLAMASPEPVIRIGLASVDDSANDSVWIAYSNLVDRLARANAKIIVLPEKTAVLSSDLGTRMAYFSKLAARDSVYLVVGVQINQTTEKDNAMWLFGPKGVLLAQYHKQHLVPALEGDLKPGHENMWREIDGSRYGLAICRDLLFSQLGRDYGNLGVSTMLVPAWDFYVDAWIESSVANMRGVENGYSIVRAGRESYLNVCDRYGRIVARKRSNFLPGISLLCDLPLRPGQPTLYARFGNWFGMLTVIAMVVILWKRPAGGHL